MSRTPARPLLPALALIALFLLTPTLATALPQGATFLSAAEGPEATPGIFSRLWDFLSAVWANGPGLEPNGAPAPGTEAGAGDNGAGLEPDGRP